MYEGKNNLTEAPYVSGQIWFQTLLAIKGKFQSQG